MAPGRRESPPPLAGPRLKAIQIANAPANAKKPASANGAKAGTEPLLGWKERGCKAEIKDSMTLNAIGVTYVGIKKRLNPQFAAATAKVAQ